MGDHQLKVTLSYAQAAAGEVGLVFAVESDRRHRLCVYHTPFEGFHGSVLDVKDASGELVQYTGRMVKRGPPGWLDYVDLPSNEPKLATFNLAQHYRVASGNTYSVQFKGNSHTNGLPDSNVLEVAVTDVEVPVTGDGGKNSSRFRVNLVSPSAAALGTWLLLTLIGLAATYVSVFLHVGVGHGGPAPLALPLLVGFATLLFPMVGAIRMKRFKEIQASKSEELAAADRLDPSAQPLLSDVVDFAEEYGVCGTALHFVARSEELRGLLDGAQIECQATDGGIRLSLHFPSIPQEMVLPAPLWFALTGEESSDDPDWKLFSLDGEGEGCCLHFDAIEAGEVFLETKLGDLFDRRSVGI